MDDLNDLLRSAAIFPRGDIDESTLAQRTTRRRRRRERLVASTVTLVLAAAVGVIGVVATAGASHPDPRVEIRGPSGSSHDTSTGLHTATKPSPATTVPTTIVPAITVPGTDVFGGSASDSTAAPSNMPTTGLATPGTAIASGPAPIMISPLPTTGGTTTTARPTASTTTTSRPTVSGTGVAGRVTAGPTCPVEPPGGCPPNPVTGTTVNAIDTSGTVVGSGVTNSTGNFEISLAPGSYTLHVVLSGPFPRCGDLEITVTGGADVNHDILCDTGIR